MCVLGGQVGIVWGVGEWGLGGGEGRVGLAGGEGGWRGGWVGVRVAECEGVRGEGQALVCGGRG